MFHTHHPPASLTVVWYASCTAGTSRPFSDILQQPPYSAQPVRPSALFLCSLPEAAQRSGVGVVASRVLAHGSGTTAPARVSHYNGSIM